MDFCQKKLFPIKIDTTTTKKNLLQVLNDFSKKYELAKNYPAIKIK
jgi:hypothetical protein